MTIGWNTVSYHMNEIFDDFETQPQCEEFYDELQREDFREMPEDLEPADVSDDNDTPLGQEYGDGFEQD